MAFSKTTIRFTQSKTINKELEQQIAESIEGSRELRQQMRRVFDAANKRIKRLKSQDDVLSPALAVLGENPHFGIGEFKSNTGSDWESLKEQYAQAVAFMRSPTSTLQGAREFTIDVKEATGLPNFVWEQIQDTVIENADLVLSEVSDKMPYKEVIQATFDIAVDTASVEMEQYLKEVAQEIQENINDIASDVADEITSGLDDIFKAWTRI